MSIKSQGYDTLLAETSEKIWKQRSEQFMKRTKSESNRDLSITVSPTFACLVDCIPRISSTIMFLISFLVPHWLNGRNSHQPNYCCVVSMMYRSTIYRICAHTDSDFLRALPAWERCDSALTNHENNLIVITLSASVTLFTLQRCDLRYSLPIRTEFLWPLFSRKIHKFIFER